MEDPLIDTFELFLSTYYSDAVTDLLNNYPCTRSLYVSFSDLDKFNLELAQRLLKEPDLVLHAFREALAARTGKDDLTVRITNNPYRVKIGDIRHDHIGKMVTFDGLVLKSTEVRPRFIVAAFQCPFCAHVMYVDQTSPKRLIEPITCEECGKKVSKFIIMPELSTFTDAQKIRLQESLEELRGGDVPATKDVELEGELTGSIAPGDMLIVNGVLRSEIKVVSGTKTPIFEVYIEANAIDVLEKVFDEINITNDDEREILALSELPTLYKELVSNIAPSVYGLEEVKEAILLQLFSGVPKSMADGTTIRGDIHVLLVGDPGLAKSIILSSAVNMAPRGLLTSGSSSTAAGLTAAATKDEFSEGAWSLEAGALVLSDRGFAAVDELDKMSKHDRDSLHEAMEQQSFSPSFELMLANGDRVEIGKFVDALIEHNKTDVIKGSNCEILPLKESIDILTTDFHMDFAMPIDRVSRHNAPDKYIVFSLQTGRTLKVTPEHPCWVVRTGRLTTLPAEEVKAGEHFPTPSYLPTTGITRVPIKPIPQAKRNRQAISLPDHYTPELCRFLGYHLSDGGYALNRGVKNGLNFSNNNKQLIDDNLRLAESLFELEPYIQKHANGLALFYLSMQLVDFMKSLDPFLMDKKTTRRIPPAIFKCSRYAIANLLRALFDGDGGVFFVPENGARITVAIVNYKMAEQVQDLLSIFEIRSSIYKDTGIYKVDIYGIENLRTFYHNIGFLSSKKSDRLKSFLDANKTNYSRVDYIPNVKDTVLDIALQLRIPHPSILGRKQSRVNKSIRKKDLKIFAAHFEVKLDQIERAIKNLQEGLQDPLTIRQKFGIHRTEVARVLGVSRYIVSNWENDGIRDSDGYSVALISILSDMQLVRDAVNELHRLAFGYASWCEVKKVERVPNNGDKWVYDVTVKPYHTFISNNLILHNTVSVAKAGIVASLHSRCSMLAAANPSSGRFDPYEPIAKQIDMKPTLLSRFDLIFMMLDKVDEENDTKLAQHVLQTHKRGEAIQKAGEEAKDQNAIAPLLLRKYIAYSRKVIPQISDEAMAKFKDFYVQLRGESRKEDAAIPITVRQLESLVRLGEASARTRLSDVVTEADADRVLALFMYCMKSVYTDPESGNLDVDWVVAGTSKTKRDRATTIRGIMQAIEHDFGPEIPAIEIVKRAQEEGIDADKAEKVLEMLKRDGIIFSPSSGVVRFVR